MITSASALVFGCSVHMRVSSGVVGQCVVGVTSFASRDRVFLVVFFWCSSLECCVSSTPLLHYPGTLWILLFLLGRGGVLARYAGVRVCILGCSAYSYVYIYGGVSVW